MSNSNSKKIRAIDMYCGMGGNSVGISIPGIDIVAGFDMWELAGKVYKDNFPQTAFYLGKIEDLDPKKVKREIGEVDLLIASPECTSHSLARGNREKSETSMETALQVTRFSEVFKPRWIIIENVIQMRSWELYKQFITKLKTQGYKVLEQILTASEFGVPQSRKRLFILCDLKKQPRMIRASRAKRKSAKTILSPNGTYKFSKLKTKARAKKTLMRAQRAITHLGAHTPFLLVYYGTDAAGGWQPLENPLRTVTTLDRFALVKPSPEGHKIRMLQVPELQAAMGFPRKFKVNHGTRRQKIHMLGNAVCPPVIKAVVKNLISNE